MTTDADAGLLHRVVRQFAGVIYELIDPRDGTCRYVGQTFDVEQRRKAHTSPTPIYQQNSGLHSWKHELTSLGLSPEFRVIEDGIPPARINEQESFWCRSRADDGCDLLNRPVGRIRKGDLLGSPKRHALATSVREIRAMLLAIDEQLRGKLPPGKGACKHLARGISELLDFIHAIDD
jgi:hypothetical protein